jgi:hypothetical protein
VLRHPVIEAEVRAGIAIGTGGERAVSVGIELAEAVAEIDLGGDRDLVHRHLQATGQPEQPGRDHRHAMILATAGNVDEHELPRLVGCAEGPIGESTVSQRQQRFAADPRPAHRIPVRHGSGGTVRE